MTYHVFSLNPLNNFLLQEGGPGVRDPTPCRRAAYHLTLEGPSAGGAVAAAGGRQILAVYILFFCGGAVFGAFLVYFVTRKRSGVRQGQRAPDGSPSSSSAKGRDLLGSSATPQSPSSASLLSEAFQQAEKRNGTTASTTTTTLLSNQGNGGHHGNALANSNPGNGHSLYANCNTGSSGPSEISVADMLDGRTGEKERMRPEGGERESGEGDEVDGGLGDGLREGMKGLEEELASLPMFKSPAPLAQGEESSI